MTVGGQGRARDEVDNGIPDNEDGLNQAQPSINRRQPTKTVSSQPSASTNVPSEPAPLSWYAAFTKSHSPPVIPTPQPPFQALPTLPWTSTDGSQNTSPTSSLSSSSLSRSSHSHQVSPPTRYVIPTPSTNASGRHQSIPISFLIHPTSEHPQQPTSFSTLPPSLSTCPPHLAKQSEWPTSAKFPPRRIDEHDEDGCISATTYRDRDYPRESLRPSRSPSVDSARFNSAATHAHIPTQACRRPSENEHLRHFEAPHLQQHGSVAFSDHPAPAMSSCSRSRVPSDVGSEGLRVEEEVESEAIQSDPEATEGQVSEEDTRGSLPLAKSPSIRRTSNPNLKTTKTGKIRHKSRKIGVSKKSTAYNRFLQQRSKALAEQFSDWTPQQRMKRIAEEWAVSEKNQHKTRRKSRFLGPDGELNLPSLSISSASKAGAATPSATSPSACSATITTITSASVDNTIPGGTP
ncbi:MAG: hypothetical protein J3R72DRAFT_122244 [Linnemannia gamsii]|nr:MAG: hypothetical protein J3R72DRAFT_122244 [Linnemannia gamsii]